LARIDDDDFWNDPEKLEKQVAFLETHADTTLVGTNINVLDYDTGVLEYTTEYPISDEDIRNSFFLNSPFAQSSILVRTPAIHLAGGYDESLRRLEDYDLWLRLGTQHKLANLPDPTTSWRSPSRTQKNVTRNRLRDNLLKLKIMSRYASRYPGFIFSYSRELLRTGIFFLLRNQSKIEHEIIIFYQRLAKNDLIAGIFVSAVFTLIWRQGQVLLLHVPKPFETLIAVAGGLTLLTVFVSGVTPTVLTPFMKIFRRYGKLFILLLGATAVGYLYSRLNYSSSVEHWAETSAEFIRIIFVFCLFLLASYLSLTKSWVLRSSLVAIAVSPLILWLAIIPQLSRLFLDGGRLHGAENDPNYLASWISLALLVSIAFLLYRIGRAYWLWLVNLILILPLLFWTGSRGGVVSFVVGVVAFLIISLAQRKHPRLFISILVIATICFAVFLISGKFLPNESQRVITARYEQNIFASAPEGRPTLARQGLSLLAKSPLGLGPAYYNWRPVLITADNRIQQPHNLFLEVGLTAGWLGLSLWLVIIFFVCRDLITLIRHPNANRLALTTCFISILTTSFVLDTFTLRWLWIIFALIIIERIKMGENENYL